MTVVVQTPYNAHIANGVTTLFGFNFQLLTAGDLQVSLDGVVQNSGFTISGIGVQSGGNVTFSVAPANNVLVEIQRRIPLARSTDYQLNGDLPSDQVDQDFDRLWQALQDANYFAGLTIGLPPGDAAAPVTVPSVSTRANSVLAFDGSGNAIAIPTADVETVADNLASVNTVATNIASVNTAAANIAAIVDAPNQAAAAAASAGVATTQAGIATTQAGTATTQAGIATTQAGIATTQATNAAASAAAAAQAALSAVLRGHISGLQMSTAGSSTTMTIGAGQATNSTAAAVMTLAASIAKTTGAWAVGSGNGGLDTGSIANNTWYHFHLIRRPDTGVVDVLISLSPTAPTLPANYTQFRRIGSGRTNGSGQWTRFFQNGDEFAWETGIGDVDVTTPGSSAVLRTLTVPTGVSVLAFGQIFVAAAAQVTHLLTDPAVADQGPGVANPQLGQLTVVAAGIGSADFRVRTNTSAQIRSRNSTTDGTVVRLTTRGWVDTRGKDA